MYLRSQLSFYHKIRSCKFKSKQNRSDISKIVTAIGINIWGEKFLYNYVVANRL